MTTLTNNSGSKKVNIRFNETYTASYIQIYNDGICNQEQVLEAKSFSTLKGAERWGNKQLNN